MNTLKNKKLFLLDMDGTIYLDNDLFDGTKDFLEYVKKSGGRYIFLTNNSSKSVDKYIRSHKSICKCSFFMFKVCYLCNLFLCRIIVFITRTDNAEAVTECEVFNANIHKMLSNGNSC